MICHVSVIHHSDNTEGIQDGLSFQHAPDHVPALKFVSSVTVSPQTIIDYSTSSEPLLPSPRTAPVILSSFRSTGGFVVETASLLLSAHLSIRYRRRSSPTRITTRVERLRLQRSINMPWHRIWRGQCMLLTHNRNLMKSSGRSWSVTAHGTLQWVRSITTGVPRHCVATKVSGFKAYAPPGCIAVIGWRSASGTTPSSATERRG